MQKITDSLSPWWGTFNFELDQSKLWRLGPLTMILRCLSGEWQVSYERIEQYEDSDISVSDTDSIPEDLPELTRYVFRNPCRSLKITPLLADRPVISRPRIPFNLSAGEEITLYVSSPLWIELSAGNNAKKLGELSIQRPSDTWFGPSTLQGELCYATTTHCRINLVEIPERRYRAITPVIIRNNADTTLSLERLNLPSPQLSIYTSDDGRLWTSTVKLTREKDGDMAALRVIHKPPKEAPEAIILSQPRVASEAGVFIRAFHAVFS